VTFLFLASVPETSEPAIGSGRLVEPGAEEASSAGPVAEALWFLAGPLFPQASALAHLPSLAAATGPTFARPGSMADTALKLVLA
jgi:hypothetical protein